MIIEGKEFRYTIGKKEYHCPVDVTMDYIGGKWKTVVLFYLISGPKRFGELNARIPQITEKMLSLQLKALVKDKFVKRKVYPETPPKVVYSLTDEGQNLSPLIFEMEKCGEQIAKKRGRLVELKT